MAEMASPRKTGYKWIALSNTTLGALMASLDANIVLISLPAIFRGIKIDPLAPGEASYLLWVLMGYSMVIATLLVSFGRLSDIFGRVRLYNLGFAIFSAASIMLFLTPGQGSTGALELIIFRLLQAIGGGFLISNSAAILTDAFPPLERGMALGLNQIAFIGGSVLGLILGGFLSAIHWRLVFLVSVPVGIAGTAWAYLKLQEISTPHHQRIDFIGNATFGAGLTIFLAALIFSLRPYGSSSMGWSNPWVKAGVATGAILLVAFLFIETRVEYPMFRLGLFRIRMFAAGNVSGFLAAVARGGLTFMLVIWLQGVWLPLHGYSFADTPLWAGIYMLPMMGSFFLMGPLSGWLSDRYGARGFSTSGMLLQTVGFLLLSRLPANFSYLPFMLILMTFGLGMGLFAAPNTTSIMNSVPAEHRGVASGMRATLQNSGALLSMSVIFSTVTMSLAKKLPPVLYSGLVAQGLPSAVARQAAQLPPTAALFAAFLGYNPMQQLLPPSTLASLPATTRNLILGKEFFPMLMAPAFMDSLRITFYGSAVIALVAAIASSLRGERYIHEMEPSPSLEESN
jgi:MFS family permease